jgi:L,D-transpeptidase YcbB
MRPRAALAFLLAFGGIPPRAAEPTGAHEALARAMAELEQAGSLVAAGESIPSGRDLAEFYRRRGYEPAWSLHGYAGAQAWQLLEAVHLSRLEGLEPSEYHEAALDSLLRIFWKRIFQRAGISTRTYIELDILLSHAFLDLGAHLLSGRHHPSWLSSRWHVHDEGLDLPAHMEASLASGGDVREILARLAPPYPEYGLLKAALADCRRRQAAGERPVLPPEGPELGRWQARHGLDTTGRADAATLSALAVPLDNRIGQLRRALEFWRWLPRDLGARHVRVNIADFRLGAYEGGREVLSRRVVLGSVRHRTPVFSDRMPTLVLNPSWTVPASIAAREILPELRKDPGYLARHDMEILAAGSDSVLARPHDIDWSRVAGAAFPYRLRQRPGPANPLGRIKFVLTNPMHVYLHDTPAPHLFQRGERAFSHGCVRVERPLELAAWVLGDPAWSADSLAREIGKERERRLPIAGSGLPVHILYWTAFIDAAGELNFRKDVYGWDRMLERLLEAPHAPEPTR